MLQLTDSGAASLQMIDENMDGRKGQGIAGWKSRQSGDARHGNGKKGAKGFLASGACFAGFSFS